jgi:fermentation-respiration switch protein FrsA (DUF1100 family)
MLLNIVHFLIAAVYLLLPLGIAYIAIRHHKRFPTSVSALIVAFIAGFAVSITLNLVYAKGVRGRLVVSQVAIATWFAAGMFLLLRMFDAALRKGIRRTFGLHREDSLRLRRVRIVAGGVMRLVILAAVALPYVMASIMTYRPKVMPLDNPRTQLGFKFERVEFRTSDGVNIVAWWIPALAVNSRGATHPQVSELWGKQTALVCHGLASSKSNQLILARQLVPGGYNVLAFDFRAHGESGGQLATFGAKEKHDVLAAVAWLKMNRAQQSQRIVGVGASMGAAALISAASDPTDPSAASIDAIAAYACYDDLWDMTRSATDTYFAPPLDWLLLHVGLPIAEAQTGADLLHYSPAHDAANLWPRPILLIHGERDDVIDFTRGQALLDAASQPKYHLFFPEGGHNDIIENETAAKIVLEFFRTARAVPVI